MHIASLRHWACPRDGCQPLQPRIFAAQREEIWEGELACPVCGAAYPVRQGLLIFLPHADLPELQRQELEQRNQFLMLPRSARQIHEETLEEEVVMRCLEGTPAASILDAGCGAGRMSLRLLRCGHEVVALDFAAARLRHLQAQAAPEMRLHCAVAELVHPPLPRAHFDAIVCLQVLEHLPSAALRQRLLTNFLALLRPGGALILTVYNFNRQRRQGAAEGCHESGIFYHCYCDDELRRELAGYRLERLQGLICRLPGVYRLQGHGLSRAADRLITRPAWIGRHWSHLWLAVARKP